MKKSKCKMSRRLPFGEKIKMKTKKNYHIDLTINTL